MSPLILSIDCSSEKAFVILSKGEELLAEKTNDRQRDHAAFVHIAIKDILIETGSTLSELDAISVISGPGSYTGLRIAFATAKGLAYSSGKPLIIISSLKLLAHAAFLAKPDKEGIYIPMIDARRMEVFTAGFDADLKIVLPESNMILDEESYSVFNDKKHFYFIGSGFPKFQPLVKFTQATFVPATYLIKACIKISLGEFKGKGFANIFTASPNYIKAFHEGS